MRQLNPGNIRKAFLVHGDEENSFALASGLRELDVREVTVPNLGEKAII